MKTRQQIADEIMARSHPSRAVGVVLERQAGKVGLLVLCAMAFVLLFGDPTWAWVLFPLYCVVTAIDVWKPITMRVADEVAKRFADET